MTRRASRTTDEQRVAYVERAVELNEQKKTALMREMRAYIRAEKRGQRVDPKLGSELHRRADAMIGSTWLKGQF